MTWQSGGGGGGGYPDVTGDGQTPGGLVIAGGLQAGDRNAVGQETLHSVYGRVLIDGTQGALDEGDNALYVRQTGTMTFDNISPIAYYQRIPQLNGHNPSSPAFAVDDAVGSTADLATWSQGGYFAGTKARIGHAGGLGLFGHTAPDTAASITGELSAVADPAAQAVLTAVIAALTADGGATDDTT